MNTLVFDSAMQTIDALEQAVGSVAPLAKAAGNSSTGVSGVKLIEKVAGLAVPKSGLR